MVKALQETDEGRLGAMDEAGIEVAVLSLAAPCIQDEFELSRAIARSSEANDALAEIIASHPDRYVGLAALPLQDPVAAADELERCVTELGFRGALANGYSLDDGDDFSVAYGNLGGVDVVRQHDGCASVRRARGAGHRAEIVQQIGAQVDREGGKRGPALAAAPTARPSRAGSPSKSSACARLQRQSSCRKSSWRP